VPQPPPSSSSAPHSWIEPAVAGRWPGARVSEIAQLRGDASARRFWRVAIDPGATGAPPSAIVIDLGPDDLPMYVRALSLMAEPLAEPPYVNVHRFMRSIGVAVPEIFRAAPNERLMLVEDVGDLALFGAALADPARAAELYRAAIDELALIHVEGTRRRDPRCYAFSIAYDARLFAWEMEQFLDCGLDALGVRCEPVQLKPELAALAARLGDLPRVFSHRDYHGQNLFVQDAGRIRVIDFQDALMAPAAQDLAVLLTTRDTARVISPALEDELLRHYLDRVAARGANTLTHDAMVESYQLCVLQHAIKMIGRFESFEQTGKAGYQKYVAWCQRQAQRILAPRADYRKLTEAIGIL
jgi:aminoglycoside/choline kinase family phosphotransferase